MGAAVALHAALSAEGFNSKQHNIKYLVEPLRSLLSLCEIKLKIHVSALSCFSFLNHEILSHSLFKMTCSSMSLLVRE